MRRNSDVLSTVASSCPSEGPLSRRVNDELQENLLKFQQMIYVCSRRVRVRTRANDDAQEIYINGKWYKHEEAYGVHYIFHGGVKHTLEHIAVGEYGGKELSWCVTEDKNRVRLREKDCPPRARIDTGVEQGVFNNFGIIREKYASKTFVETNITISGQSQAIISSGDIQFIQLHGYCFQYTNDGRDKYFICISGNWQELFYQGDHWEAILAHGAGKAWNINGYFALLPVRTASRVKSIGAASPVHVEEGGADSVVNTGIFSVKHKRPKRRKSTEADPLVTTNQDGTKEDGESPCCRDMCILL